LDQEFPHNKGCALKENLKLRNKGGGKRITKRLFNIYKVFFARKLRAADHYSPKSMHSCLEELAAEGENTLGEILTVKTIKG
ncbi:2729_t:CDS:1, partial [Funneliformis geosporum]